jgi:ATP-dependent Zn protease
MLDLIDPLRAVALHEAAHAVVGETLGLRVKSLSIVPSTTDDSLGRVLWEDADGQ